MVIALALSGSMSFNPETDTLINEKGEQIKLDPPTGDELPKNGFDQGDVGYVPPVENGDQVQIQVNPDSDRLQLLEPFEAWDGKDYTNLRVLVKATGKCTTDHISPAGKWLKYRGHLENISDNMFTGAVNAFREEIGKGKNFVNGEIEPYPKVAKAYRNEGIGWIAVGDENYGEGSSREHAAMEPRFLNGKAIVVKSFARIHETNLKKQGMLPLTFANPTDYDKIREDDLIDLKNLIKPGENVILVAKHLDGTQDEIPLSHTMSASQIEWFKAGAALNLMKG